MENENILKIDNLHVSFDTYAGEVHAVRGVSLEVKKGEVMAIVGESGCGKSVTAQTIMKLNPMPPARIKEGSIDLCGKDIVAASEKEMQSIRGQLVSMIFQDPMTCMNPTMKVGKQLTETLVKKKKIAKADAEKEAIRLLKLVQIPNPEERAKQYPHEFSGGMRQRVMIAMALACEPKLLIADEPTTALDVTIQAQILELMVELKKKINMSVIIITHDLGVVSDVCDRIAVMYAGKIVEIGSTDDIFYNPQHCYTLGLLKSIPKIHEDEHERLIPIEGTPVDLLNPPAGCPFASRCDKCMKICLREMPPYTESSEGHVSACWLIQKRQMEEAKAEGGKEA